jgi:2-amino-4-hydroxy-6-hydroxymethyldihydropteridine diphosphokinase
MEEKIISNSFVYLSIGSNLGDRLSNIENANTLIRNRIGEILSKSLIYENPPKDFTADILFYNMCVLIRTILSPIEVLDEIQSIEKELGRTNKTVDRLYSSRVIDIDIIFYNNQIIKNERLSIPHPLFRDRRFVLIPLNDIANRIIDPLTSLSVNQLLAVCADKSSHLVVKNNQLGTGMSLR